jgi:hypothetical protein
MSILYVGCMKFSTNRFVRNFCPFSICGENVNNVVLQMLKVVGKIVNRLGHGD